MRTSRAICAFAIAAAIVGTLCAASISSAAPNAEAAIRAAAKHSRYVFVTFVKGNDAANKAMLASVKSIQGKYASRADFTTVDVADSANKAVVSRYGADRSPLPLTIVIASNGAVTAGFPKQIKTTDMTSVFVSDGTAAVLKVLQSGKLAAVCIEGSKTSHNKECLATARGLKSDSRLGGAVEVLTIDPLDRAEAKLMKEWKLDAGASDAQIVVVGPPGKFMGRFDATTSKDSIVASLMKSMSGGCCGGGSCCK